MPSEYISKKDRVRDFIESQYFPIDGSEPAFAIPRVDIEIYCFRKYGADKSLVAAVLEQYGDAGLLLVTSKKVERIERKKVEEKPESE